jgi:hypothetical protein
MRGAGVEWQKSRKSPANPRRAWLEGCGRDVSPLIGETTPALPQALAAQK